MTSRFIMPRQGVNGQNLTPEDGAKLIFWHDGLTTNKNTYADEAATVISSNPVIADANGLFESIWLDGDYSVTLKDKNNVQLWGPETVRELVNVSDVTIPTLQTTVQLIATATSTPILNDIIEVSGYTTAGDGGGAQWMHNGVTGQTISQSPAQLADALLNDASGNQWAIMPDLNGVDFKQIGVIADGITDTVPLINILLASGFGKVNFSDGTYFLSAATLESDQAEHGLVVKSNTTISFSSGALLLHEVSTDSRHIFGSGAGLSNVHFINVQIDGNESSTNGIGINDARDCSIDGGFIRNVWGANVTPYVTPLGGGRAITFQSFKKNITISGVKFDNCSTCIDVSFPGTSGLTCGAVVISDITAEDSEVIFGGLSGDADFLPNSEIQENLNTIQVNGVSFKNCGASGKNPLRTQISVKRQNTTGNGLPFSSLARTATSYSGQDWLVSASGFDAGDTEWSETASYNVGDDVKITEVGQNSAIFSFDHTSGLSISNVRGYNEASYGTIGAFYRGIGANVSISDVVVTIHTLKTIWLSPNPVNNTFARESAKPEKIFLDNYINHGTTEFIVEADTPVNQGATVDYMPDVMRLERIFCDANTVTTDFVGPRLASQTTNPFKASMVLIHRNNTGVLSGSCLQLSKISTSDADWAATADQGFKNIMLHNMEIRTDSTDVKLRLTRTGTSAAQVDLIASAAGLYLDHSLFFPTQAWNGNLIRMGAYRLWIDSSDRLRINNGAPTSDTDGTVIGTQT